MLKCALCYVNLFLHSRRTEQMRRSALPRVFPKRTVSLLNWETKKKTGSFPSAAQMQHFSSCLETDRSDVLNLVMTRIILYLKYHKSFPQNCQSVHQNVFEQDAKFPTSCLSDSHCKNIHLHKSFSLPSNLKNLSFSLFQDFYRTVFT